MVKVTYDKDADAAYIYFETTSSEVASTQGDWPFHVDINVQGEVVGIEVMDASKVMNPAYLQKAVKD